MPGVISPQILQPSLLGLNTCSLKIYFENVSLKDLVRFYEIFFTILFHNHFCKNNIKSFKHINKSFHFAKDPESLSMLGHITSRLDYWIINIWEYPDSSLLLRPLSILRFFQRISQFHHHVVLYTHGGL